MVVNSKYGSTWGGWCSCEPIGAYGVGLWKFIRRGWGKFRSHIRFKVGDDLRLDSGMIIGVGIEPLRKHFQFYLVLIALWMRLSWNFLEASFS
jgi:hypothetical protein